MPGSARWLIFLTERLFLPDSGIWDSFDELPSCDQKMYIPALYYRLRVMGAAEMARRAGRRFHEVLGWRAEEKEADRLARPEDLERILEGPLLPEPVSETELDFARSTGLLRRANAAMEGEFVLFGRNVKLKLPVEWLADPLSGASAEKLKRLPVWSELYRKKGIDFRSIWELNRLQFLVDWARAYRLTGQERYAHLVSRHIESWQSANPYGRTVNWSSALEAGMRGLSIIIALSCIRDTQGVRDENFAQRMARLLYLHGKFISSHLSCPSSGFNHLAGEAAALSVLGICLPEVPEAEDWREKGKWALEESIFRLIRIDGGAFEGSLHYLAFVCRLAVLAGVICDRLGEHLLSQHACERMARAYRFLCAVTDGGGSISEFGDSDNASFPAPAPASARERHLSTLNLLWLFCEGQDLLHDFHPDEESLWLFGEKALAQEAGSLEKVRPPLVERFDKSGRYVVRSQAGPTRVFLRFECGHWGDGSTWAHAHADRLSFSLFINGIPFFIDPGTGAYLTDSRIRDYFRSTAAHNTVTVDGLSQSEPLACFLWRSPVLSSLTACEKNEREVVLEGYHTGYSNRRRGPDRLIHRRKLVFQHRENRLEITDYFETGGSHQVSLNFILHPDCSVRQQQSGPRLEITNGPVTLSLQPDNSCRTSLYRGKSDPPRGWFSPGFLRWEPCWQVVLDSSIHGDCSLRTLIEWKVAEQEKID